ncbi:origin recognition complex subunit 4 [Sporothrix epigloea]|uniref:Origin recognition complex subunit 4 n=1 Tax=Sporothrix epigloea TaxID=1892477 RepID=A0ABP0DMU4_9PEZI
MLGRAGRKRARLSGGDSNGVTDENTPVAEEQRASVIKRQKLAGTGSPTSSRTAPRFDGGDDAALFPGPDITRTPSTLRTVSTMTSAITNALPYGGRLLPRPFTSLLNERSSRTSSHDDLDKIYNVPEDYDTRFDYEAELDKDAARESLTVTESDAEEHTLVGATSPIPDTPSKKLPKSAASYRTNSPRNELQGSPSRPSRVRSIPKRYSSGNADPGSSNSVRRTARPRASLTARNGDISEAEHTDAAVTQVPSRPLASTAETAIEVILPSNRGAKSGEHAASQAPAKRPRGRPPKTTSQAQKPVRGSSATKSASIKSKAPALHLQRARATDTAVQEAVDDDSEGDSDSDTSDDEVCAICSKPDSEPPNEIVFCETCDLAVHQQCYNIPHIPEGDWFCKNCTRQNLKPPGQPLAEEIVASQDNSHFDRAEDTEHYAEVAAAQAATDAARDLAPDIANFEHHLAKMKQILLGRCTGRHRVRLRGQDEAYGKVHQVVKQTVVAGEGNSMMVIGARGTGKTTMVESIIEDLAAEHGEAFHVVRLNGFIHTDDKLALREIWRQLGKEMAVEDDIVNKTQTNNYADTLASLLALLSHPSEIQAAPVGTGGTGGTAETDTDGGIAVPVVTSTSVIFVIDEFDLFATHARQTLLYNLFDIAQARKAPIAVLGLTTKIDVVESLEKRVKSRFSHRYVYLPLARSLPAFWDVCRLGLVMDDDETDGMVVDMDMEPNSTKGRDEFRQWWKHMVDTAKDDADFQDQLAFHYYSSKSVPAFWTTCLLPLATVSSTAPRLRLPPIEECAFGGNLGALHERGVRRGIVRPARSAGESVVAGRKSLDDFDMLPLAPPDSKLHLLAALSELELSLLISAARLDIVLSTDTVNFAMAYDEYVSLMGRQRVQASLAGSGLGSGTGAIQHRPSGRGVGRPPGVSTTVVGGGARVWGRGIASRAWERLAALGLLIPAGLGASSRARGGGSTATVTSGLEGRSMWRTEVALEEIATAPGVRLGAVLGRWCKEI